VTATLTGRDARRFRPRIEDLIVFLDAYLDRPAAAAPTGFSRKYDGSDRADWIWSATPTRSLWGAERMRRVPAPPSSAPMRLSG